MKLSDKAVAALKPRDKAYKKADGGGMYLEILPTGAKSWRLKYRVDGKEKRMTFGLYPIVSLKDARAGAFEAKKLIVAGIDPMAERKAVAELAAPSAPVETVEAVAREWFEKFSTQWAPGHASKILRRLERDLFPYLGRDEIKSVTPPQLLSIARRVESRGAIETAHRLLNNAGQVWRYAVATGKAERDITPDLKGAIPPTKTQHLGAIVDPDDVGALLRAIDEYRGSASVKLALRLAPYVFLRPGELRQARKDEFDLEKAEWVIPEGRMKGRRQHVVPLSDQAIAIVQEAFEASGEDCEYLFPTPQTKVRCISDMALLTAVRRMGYGKDEMTAHGFRAMASTNLEHLGYDVRIIELQLAHADSNEVRAAYKRDISRLQIGQRTKMMQEWASYLDELRSVKKVVPFKKQA